MEETLKNIDHFEFSTSTAEVEGPNDFIIELTALPETGLPAAIVTIKTLDELVDFLEEL